jgi:hypothetical protein
MGVTRFILVRIDRGIGPKSALGADFSLLATSRPVSCQLSKGALASMSMSSSVLRPQDGARPGSAPRTSLLGGHSAVGLVTLLRSIWCE